MIFVDVYEPTDIEDLIKMSVPTFKTSLNHGPGGIADYMWTAWDGHRIQIERKTIDEILSSMDAVEELLSRELKNGIEETILLYEGTCEPIPGLRHMACQSWKLGKGGKVMVPGRKYNTSYKGLCAWFYQLDKAGVTVMHTSHYLATATAIVAMYDSSQSKEHKTLRRYIKDKIYIQDANPHVLTLMGIKGANLGEAKAKALIDRYGTVWYTLNRPLEELAETLVGEEGSQKRLGVPSAQKLLGAVGRH
jgi:ERCC4-type nuclease